MRIRREEDALGPADAVIRLRRYATPETVEALVAQRDAIAALGESMKFTLGSVAFAMVYLVGIGIVYAPAWAGAPLGVAAIWYLRRWWPLHRRAMLRTEQFAAAGQIEIAARRQLILAREEGTLRKPPPRCWPPRMLDMGDVWDTDTMDEPVQSWRLSAKGIAHGPELRAARRTANGARLRESGET